MRIRLPPILGLESTLVKSCRVGSEELHRFIEQVHELNQCHHQPGRLGKRYANAQHQPVRVRTAHDKPCFDMERV